jgi:hypothetical protein
VDVGHVPDVSEVRTASKFIVVPEDENSMYLENAGNITHIHMVLATMKIIIVNNYGFFLFI